MKDGWKVRLVTIDERVISSRRWDRIPTLRTDVPGSLLILYKQWNKDYHNQRQLKISCILRIHGVVTERDAPGKDIAALQKKGKRILVVSGRREE